MSHPELDAEHPTLGGLYEGYEAYRTPTSQDYRSLLVDGLVVPDTNVFLNLYRYNQQTRNDLFAVLRGLGPNLWVPSQVMTEFWRNRERVLQDPRDIEKTAKELAAKRDEAANTLHWWASRVGLAGERSKELAAVLSAAFSKVIEQISELADDNVNEFVRDTNSDPVLVKLEEILHCRVGAPPSEKEIEEARLEAERRAELKRPPGYMDIGKAGPGPIGDYLVWVQILQEAKRRQKNVLIVTGDVKEDWWRKERGELRGPRPELAQEMREFANVGLFMLRPESLLLHARQVLRVKVRDQSVEDIERVAESVRVSGTVKWFDEPKGYGFIVCDDGSEVFVHYSEINSPGYRILFEGERVTFLVQDTDKGPQAKDVQRPPKRSSVRVYELAKEFGVESEAVMDQLKDMGEFVRSASSTIEAPVVRRLREVFRPE